jgi:D-alanyl-D-alanine carboxypeptidase
MIAFKSQTGRLVRQTSLAALGFVFGIVPLLPSPALARHHHHASANRPRVVVFHVRGRGRMAPHVRFVRVRTGVGAPPFSSFAVDGNSGRILQAVEPDALRHPASITKVMTLYLLFEQIERGRLSLDSRIDVSAHAAAQSPTKLGLRPGSSIRVEDAVKAIVTKSANDMAVAIAERIGGDESTFARMMTRKAHKLGMSRTTFVNASGLPDDRQLTTARDLATLGRAIHDRYPQYFHFFSTPSFRYAGQYMANHNHLMERVEGMDGIKTGYTNASGFNLLSSVSRKGHWLISVVLGGRTRLGRDRIMADLIESEIDKCATTRTAPLVAENNALEEVAEAVPVIVHENDPAPPVQEVDDETAEKEAPVRLHGALPDEPQPEPAQELAATATERPIPEIPLGAAPQARRPLPRPRPAFVSGLPQGADRDMTATGSIGNRRDRLDGSTSRYVGVGTATPSTLKHQPQRARVEKAQVKPVLVASLESDAPVATSRATSPRGGSMIQIGAPPSVEQANELLVRAKTAGGGALTGAHPFTEKVQKGSATLFRARFTGLAPERADKACTALRRAGFACFAMKE